LFIIKEECECRFIEEFGVKIPAANVSHCPRRPVAQPVVVVARRVLAQFFAHHARQDRRHQLTDDHDIKRV